MATDKSIPSAGLRECFASAAALSCLVVLFITGCTETEDVQKLSNDNTGLDPHGYATAREMYAEQASIPYDSNAATLIAEVDASLKSGTSIDDEGLFGILLQLNSYRHTAELQEYTGLWIEAIVAELRRQPTQDSGKRRLLRSANAFYLRGEFFQAAESYLALLREDPRQRDARNNLALALDHMQFHYPALVELEILRRLDSDYLPAMVNLTVVYEQLGRTDDARTLAYETARKRSQVVPAMFNAGWYLNLEQQYDAAEEQLHPVADMALRQEHVRMHDLNLRQAGKIDDIVMNLSAIQILNNGAVAAWRGNISIMERIVFVALFLFGGIILTWLCAAPFRRKGPWPAVAIFLVLGVGIYLFCWGLPQGLAWLLLAGFIFIGVMMTWGRATA